MKNKTIRCTARFVTKLPTLLTLAAALLAWPLATRAADIYWTNTLGGFWGDAVNWSPNQTPAVSDNAFITQPGTYTLFVDVYTTVGSLTAGAATGTQTVAIISFGSLTLDSTSIFSSRAVLSLAGGILAGPGEITVNGPMNWTGGTINGDGVLNANGGMAITGNAAKFLFRTINNGDTVIWSGAEIYSGQVVFNNRPGRLFDIQTDAAWFYQGAGVTTFNNEGILRKSAGTGTTFLQMNYTNTGTIEVQVGVLSPVFIGQQNGLLSVSAGAGVDFPSGAHTFGAGHSNNIAGAFQISGGFAFVETNVTATLPSLSMSGGFLHGDGTWTVNGPMTWTGGEISGYGVLNANGGMVISGPNDKSLAYRTVNNGGTVTWTGSGDFHANAGAVFNNLPGRLFDVQTDADLLYNAGAHPTFNNAGTFRKSAGATNEATRLIVFFRNTGLVEVLSGNIEFIQDTYFRQTAGATLLKGGNIQMNGSYDFRFAGGLVGGSGKVLSLPHNVLTYDIIVSGQLSPGLSAGRMEIQGNYVQPLAASCNIEIGGTIAGTNYDQVVITGGAQLAGTINVVSINGFVPALGDRFEIMKFGSQSGSVTFQGLDITNGISLRPVFSPTNLVLVATNAPLSAAPKLNLAYNGDSMWLWWPLGYGGFNVQSTTNLNSPIPWSPVNPAELNRHTFTNAGPAKFFRMVQP